MRKLIVSALLLFTASLVLAQRDSPPSKGELAEITERGRQLAAYDVAAWNATDEVMATKPTEGSVARYIARKTDDKWVVVFGRFNEKRDKFLIVFEATQGTSAVEFKIKKHEPPHEDSGFYFAAAKAIETALADFRGENRPYNVVVLPAKSDQMHVYVLPAQTHNGVYTLGGDVRYLISKDASKIVERRQLHKAILEFKVDENAAAGFHTAILDDIPEDTDVFFVLSRKPSVPEYIGTHKYVFRVEPDGTVNYLMTIEAFQKMKER
jgi:hypothetical protein